LLILARTEHQVAGRKVVIFFEPGLQLDTNAKDMLPTIAGNEPRWLKQLCDRRERRLVITALPDAAIPPPTADELRAIIADARSHALR
jgi:hypothetical protein